MKTNKIMILYLILVILISKISYSSTTYQENEDSTYCSGDWNSSYPCSNTYDGDWSTRGAVYEGNNEEHEADVIFIYNKSENSTSLSVLQVKETSSSLKNLTIPDSCWYHSDQQVKFKVVLNYYCSHWDCHRDEFGNEDCVCTSWRRNADLYCYNGSWVSMDSWDDGTFYESGIWWNCTSPRSSYPSITDCSGDWYYSSCLNTYDGDWGTYGNTTSADDTTPEKIASVNLTYYKPSHATSSSVLQVKETSSSLKNLTIPDSCWYHSDQQVKFKVVLVSECTHETCHHYGDDIYCDCDEWNNTGSISCYNGSWVSMDSWDDNIFHESEMWWKYPPPSTSISPDGHDWTNQDVSFTLSCSDSGSGCNQTYYSIINSSDSCPTADDPSYTNSTAGTVTCPSGSVCQKRVCYYSTDNAGNTETVKKSDTFLIDKIAPTYDFTSLEGCDYFNSSSNTCYMLPGHTFNVIIQHHDFNSTPYKQYISFTNTTCSPNNCGCSQGFCSSANEIKSYVYTDSTEFHDYCWNDDYLNITSAKCEYPEGCSGYYAEENWTIIVGNANKIYRIWNYLADEAINWVGYTLTNYYVVADSTPPTTSISPDGQTCGKDVSFTLSCSDSGSGCNQTYYSIINNGDSCPAVGSYTSGTTGTVSCPSGSVCQKRVCYYSVDNVGNVESVHQSNVFYIDKRVLFKINFTYHINTTSDPGNSSDVVYTDVPVGSEDNGISFFVTPTGSNFSSIKFAQGENYTISFNYLVGDKFLIGLTKAPWSLIKEKNYEVSHNRYLIQPFAYPMFTSSTIYVILMRPDININSSSSVCNRGYKTIFIRNNGRSNGRYNIRFVCE